MPSNVTIAKSGSQHAKFLPQIRSTISNLEKEKLWRNFKNLTEKVRLPDPQDVEMETRVIGTKAGETITGRVPKNKEDRGLALLLMKMNDFKDGFAPVETVVAKIMDAAAPTFELSIGDIGVFRDFEPAMPKGLKNEWNCFAERLRWALEERGYRQEEATTPFEHALGADANSGFGPLMREKVVDLKGMHVPICILENKLSLEETAVLRELEVFYGAFPKFYGLKGRDTKMISLSTIGDSGKANWLPMAIDEKKLAGALKKYSIEETFFECALPDAKLNMTLVEKSVHERFAGYQFVGSFQ